MTPESLVAELRNAGVVLEAADGQLRLTAGRGTLTPNLLESLKNHKAGLLEILQKCSPSPNGLSAVEASLPPNTAPSTQVHPFESVAQTRADGESYADREFARFEQVAVPMPGGGLYDPINGSAEMPSGIPGADWDAFVADCGNLGRGKKA